MQRATPPRALSGLVVALALVALPAAGADVGTAFTYQGQLQDDGSPASGDFDLQFTLFDAETGGTQLGSPVTVDDVEVVDGRFGVKLDFGSAFGREARWLEIAVRPGAGGSFTTLSPRQELTPAPYALALPGVSVDEAAGFVGVGRGLQVTGDDNFAVSADNGADYVGMYVESQDPGGLPFYGYASDNNALGWTYFQEDQWYLHNGSDRLRVGRDGGLRILDVPDGADDTDALQVGSAPHNGILIGADDSFPPTGLYVASPGVEFDALWVNTADPNGEWGLFTIDNVFADNVSAAAQTIVARVGSDGSLAPGDVAAAAGVGDPMPEGHQRLAEVRRADGTAGLAGVVTTKLELVAAPNKDGARRLQSVGGRAVAGDLVQIVIAGVADVNVTPGQTIAQGARLTADAAAPGRARPLQQTVLDGMTVSEGAPVIGTALEPARGSTVPVLVDSR